MSTLNQTAQTAAGLWSDSLGVTKLTQQLEEMEAAGEIGSVASYHYSFMGATDPTALESQARSLAKIMIKDEVDVVLLCPV